MYTIFFLQIITNVILIKRKNTISICTSLISFYIKRTCTNINKYGKNRLGNVVKVSLTCENLDIQPYVHVQPIGKLSF